MRRQVGCLVARPGMENVETSPRIFSAQVRRINDNKKNMGCFVSTTQGSGTLQPSLPTQSRSFFSHQRQLPEVVSARFSDKGTERDRKSFDGQCALSRWLAARTEPVRSLLLKTPLGQQVRAGKELGTWTGGRRRSRRKLALRKYMKKPRVKMPTTWS